MHSFAFKKTLSIFIFKVFFLSLHANTQQLPNCIYISSYHKGYEWSDEIEKSIRTILKDKCNLTQFDMDTKRNKNEDFKQQQGMNAKDLINKIKPKVVIVSDDNAAKYVVAKYYKDSLVPFVFCGINWTAEEYGFPYKNVTGMIEITPIKQLFKQSTKITKGNNAIFIGDNTETDKKDLVYFKKYAKKMGIHLGSALVDTKNEWKNRYKNAQDRYDFIILGHNSAINGWDDMEMSEFVLKEGKKFSVTTYSWMVKFTHYGLIIKPQEQGDWAANTALAVLNGYKISNISITSNKSWDSWINLKLLKKSKIKISQDIIEKAKKFD